jgi:RNA recognition motif-containing protein
MSIRLYVGNLPKEVERQEFDAVFSDFEGMISTKVITDRKTGKCRGFGFVTVKTEENAEELIEKFNGYLFKETPLKIERAQPRNKSKAEEDGETVTAISSSSSSGSKRKGKSSGSKRSSSSSDSDSVQPDPRWAQELEKLKELLATQTANS